MPKPKYVCGICGRGFNNLDDVYLHICKTPNEKEKSHGTKR